MKIYAKKAPGRVPFDNQEISILDILLYSSDSSFFLAMGKDWKGKLSPILYLAAALTAYVTPWISGFFFVLVALIWFMPDKRIEHILKDR